jgi:transcription termination factor NusA
VADALSAMLQEAMAESRAQTGVREIENMPDEWAQLLEDAGYDDLDSVINASVDDLTAIEGVDEDTAAQMIELARKHEQVDEVEESDEDSEESDEDSDEESDDETDEESETEDEDTGEEASDEQKAEASVE